MITLILTGAIAAGSDLGIIAKLNEFLFPFTLLPFFFMLIAMVQKGSMTHILPLLQLDWSMVFKGVFSATYSYAGYKVALMFAGFYQQPEKALKSHTYAVAAVIFSYWYICLTTLSVFGTSELKKVVYPVLEVVKVIHMPALVFDRLESGILAIWLLAVFTSIINLHASLVQMVIEYFQLKEKTRRWIAFAFVPIAYGLGTIPKNYEEVSVYTGWIGLYGNTIALIVSVLLLVLAVIRRKKGGARHENSSHP